MTLDPARDPRGPGLPGPPDAPKFFPKVLAFPAPVCIMDRRRPSWNVSSLVSGVSVFHGASQ